MRQQRLKGWTVESVDVQGVATIELSIDRVKIAMSAPGMEETTYDSAADEESTTNIGKELEAKT